MGCRAGGERAVSGFRVSVAGGRLEAPTKRADHPHERERNPLMSDLATTVTVIDACGRATVPVLLLSDPGMGKSSLVRSLAAAEGVPCETVLGSIREPADVAGLPVVTDSGVILSPPAWAQRLANAQAGYLFLDELTTCPPAVLLCACQGLASRAELSA